MYDIHAQKALETFGHVTARTRRLAKIINYNELYGGTSMWPHSNPIFKGRDPEPPRETILVGLAREFKDVDIRMTELRSEYLKKKYSFKRELHTQEYPSQLTEESESVAACRIVHRADRLLNIEQELC